MQIHDVEQNSDEWDNLRAGLPTASEFSKVITSQGKPSKQLDGYAAQLAAEAYHGGPIDRWEGNEYTERGHALEDEARSLYTFDTDSTITQVGFITLDGMGCSPDSLVGDDGLLEIKCLKGANHVTKLAYIAKHNRCPTDYFSQIQGQMLITGRPWCDLFIYHPALPPKSFRVMADIDFCKALSAQIDAVKWQRDEYLKVLGAA